MKSVRTEIYFGSNRYFLESSNKNNYVHFTEFLFLCVAFSFRGSVVPVTRKKRITPNKFDQLWSSQFQYTRGSPLLNGACFAWRYDSFALRTLEALPIAWGVQEGDQCSLITLYGKSPRL